MKPDTVEGRIKIVKELLWQRVTAQKVRSRQTASISIYKRHRDDSRMPPGQFHDALMAVVGASSGLSSSFLTDDDELLKFEMGGLSTEPHLYVVKVRPSWRDEYRKEIHNYSSTSEKRTELAKATKIAEYKDLTLYSNGDIKCRGVLVPIKGKFREILGTLIFNAPHVVGFNDIRERSDSKANDSSIRKYRHEIQKILDKIGIHNAIHPDRGMGLKLKY